MSYEHLIYIHFGVKLEFLHSEQREIVKIIKQNRRDEFEIFFI